MSDTPQDNNPKHKSGDTGDILDGWKAIAAYLGKSVRTVQRWRAAFGMPVHRLGAKDGETVYAYPVELDAWRKTASLHAAEHESAAEAERGAGQDGAPELDRGAELDIASELDRGAGQHSAVRKRPLLWQTAIAIVGIALGVVLFASLVHQMLPSAGAGTTAASAGPPALYSVSANELRVFDSTRTFLWRHVLAEPLTVTAYEDPAQIDLPAATRPMGRLGRPPRSQFGDIDGDGKVEVLFMAIDTAVPSHGRLYCFSHDGRERWSYAPGRSVNFGDKYQGTAAAGAGVVLGPARDGVPSIWGVFFHQVWFPAVVVRLDSTGRTLGEYWSNGRINAVVFGTVDRRDWVFLGGPNNEHKGATLAGFDVSRFGGAAPAAKRDYQCLNCPAGEPGLFLVFPSTEVGRIDNGYAWVGGVTQTSDGETVVDVVNRQKVVPGTADALSASVLYRFDGAFRLIGAEFFSRYAPVHDALFKERRLDHAFNETRELSQALPVLRWDGRRFEVLPNPVR